jgi:hypothetical protein
VTRRPRLQKPEPQWANGKWTVARQRPIQHAYLVIYGGQHVGWVAPVAEGGWRWITTWNPRTGGSQLRQSKHAFRSWEHAVGALAATAMAKAVTTTPDVPDVENWVRHYLLHGKPWTPTPEPVAVTP